MAGATSVMTPRDPRPIVAAIGMATVDYLYVLPRHPAEDTENPVSEHHIVVGGPAGRGAIAAARLGGEVRLLATCGTGTHAGVLQGEITAQGAAADWVAAEAPSQRSAVIVASDTATRSTIWLGQPRADGSVFDRIEAAIAGADVVLLDCTDEALTRRVVTETQARGIPMVVDTGSFKGFTLDILAGVDHAICPLKWFTTQHPDFDVNDLNNWRESIGSSVLAATDGASGGHYVTKGDHTVHSWVAAPVAAVDTCGAGDTFHGAYAWAVGAGFSVAECFEVARWSAGLKTTTLGNAGIPSWGDLTEHLLR